MFPLALLLLFLPENLQTEEHTTSPFEADAPCSAHHPLPTIVTHTERETSSGTEGTTSH